MERDNELIIHIAHGYDSLKSPDGVDCFGCYINGKNVMYVADDIPKDQFFFTIAHEYRHYIQDIEGMEYSEEDADNFALSVFDSYYQKGRIDERTEIISQIKQELANSDHTNYVCDNGRIIHTDVGYIEDWFVGEYENVLNGQKNK